MIAGGAFVVAGFVCSHASRLCDFCRQGLCLMDFCDADAGLVSWCLLVNGVRGPKTLLIPGVLMGRGRGAEVYLFSILVVLVPVMQITVLYSVVGFATVCAHSLLGWRSFGVRVACVGSMTRFVAQSTGGHPLLSGLGDSILGCLVFSALSHYVASIATVMTCGAVICVDGPWLGPLIVGLRPIILRLRGWWDGILLLILWADGH